MIHCESIVEIALPQKAVFAFADDTSKAPQWLGLCHSLDLVSSPPKRVGSALRYLYKEGGRVREMQGTVTAFEPPRCLEMKLADAMFEIAVSFQVEPSGAGSRFTYVFELTPRKLIAKLMAPVVRGMTQKQVVKDAAKLKSLLESRTN